MVPFLCRQALTAAESAAFACASAALHHAQAAAGVFVTSTGPGGDSRISLGVPTASSSVSDEPDVSIALSLLSRAVSDLAQRAGPVSTTDAAIFGTLACIQCLAPQATAQQAFAVPFLSGLADRCGSEQGKACVVHLLGKVQESGQSSVKGPVCITGATGYIASHIALQLLQSGYTVHGTVRSTGDESKLRHLLRMPGASTRLKLFEADLMGEEAAFVTAMQGCTAVFHTASPFFLSGYADGEEALVRPAVQGTTTVCNAAISTPSVSRVILTSSTAAVYLDERAPDHVYDEDDWSDVDYLRAGEKHYALSKVLAERQAWSILGPHMAGQGRPCELVVIAPTLVVGPMLQDALNVSCAQMADLLNGEKTTIPNATKCLVDVRDVAQMHIAAMEDPKASGRYLCIADCWPYEAIVKSLAGALSPSMRGGVPTLKDAGPPPNVQAFWSKERAWELGVHFRPLEQTLADTAISLYVKGHLDSTLPEELRSSTQGAVTVAQGGSQAAQAAQ